MSVKLAVGTGLTLRDACALRDVDGENVAVTLTLVEREIEGEPDDVLLELEEELAVEKTVVVTHLETDKTSEGDSFEDGDPLKPVLGLGDTDKVDASDAVGADEGGKLGSIVTALDREGETSVEEDRVITSVANVGAPV